MKPIPNIIFTLALASIGYGCYLLHPAAPWIVCGSIVCSVIVYARVKGIG